MKPTVSDEQVAILAQLFNFLQRVLRMTPVAFWWLLVTLVIASGNLALREEVWPQVLYVEVFFVGVILLAFVSLAWVASDLAWRIADTIRHEPWNTVWRLAAVLGFIGSLFFTGILLLGLLLWMPSWAS